MCLLPLGTSVDVIITVTDAGGLTYTQTFTISAIPPGGGAGDNASISALQYAPGAALGQTFALNVSQCLGSSGLLPLPDPMTLSAGGLSVPASASFLPTNILKSEDVLFVQVFDPEANSDALLAEQVIVRLTTPGLDQETIQVTETAVDTGIFVGYIQTNRDPASSANCALEVAIGSTVSVTYVEGGVDVVSGTVLVDPFGRVFDSATGTPINGATLTLLDAATNLPADVFADDGVSSFPATLVSGDGTYTSDSGAYRYPYVVAGDYVLQVTPPNRFSFPSIATDAQLQVLPGAPYALTAGSRGQTFTVPVGPAVQVDVPLDLLPITPTASSLELLAVLPGGDPSVTTYAQPTTCAAPGGFTTLPDPVTLAQGVLPIPANLALSGVDRLARGDALFLQVIDPDQDLDPFARISLSLRCQLMGSRNWKRCDCRKQTIQPVFLSATYKRRATQW